MKPSRFLDAVIPLFGLELFFENQATEAFYWKSSYSSKALSPTCCVLLSQVLYQMTKLWSKQNSKHLQTRK